ncbi:hypothetical protein EIW28_01945 [Glycomyces terrestris]|uniref:Uncharacterized protein n=1 Tax=Glycomyces terrestris TaxID=2493553 RepID=A0A426V3R2_9ACTN|nr:hypothetical protein EIW28_01945 [Glycomyces terrestris]
MHGPTGASRRRGPGFADECFDDGAFCADFHTFDAKSLARLTSAYAEGRGGKVRPRPGPRRCRPERAAPAARFGLLFAVLAGLGLAVAAWAALAVPAVAPLRPVPQANPSPRFTRPGAARSPARAAGTPPASRAAGR